MALSTFQMSRNLSRVVSPSQLVLAASSLRPVAQFIWQHRDLLGEAVTASKNLVRSLVPSTKARKGKPRRGAPMDSSSRSMIDTSIGFSNTPIIHNPSFSRFSTSAGGNNLLLYGSELFAVCARLGTGSAGNGLLFSTDAVLTGNLYVRSNFARLLSPVNLILDTVETNYNVGLYTRLAFMSSVFSRYRFHHVHIRYVPTKQVSDTNHGSFFLGFTTDSSFMDGETINTSTGLNTAQTQTFSTLSPSVAAPSWSQSDLEINFHDPPFLWCDPEGSNVGDTADSEAVGLRSVSQGEIVGYWMDKLSLSSGAGVRMGTFYVDYVVEFDTPSLQAPDVSVSLTRDERKILSELLRSGWRPSDETPKPLSPVSSSASTRGRK